MKKFKKLAIISLLGLFLIALPVVALAGKDKMGQAIYIGPEEIVEGNFIKVGNTIEINGAVNGDVIVAGNIVTIAGPVAGDVIAVGNIVRVTGPVGGSVRVAGSTVQIDGEVDRNVWAVGSSVTLSSDSKVGWDVYSAGATIEVKSPVGGNVWAAGASIVLGNTVGKDVKAAIDTEGKMVLYPGAKVAGDLVYKAGSEEQLELKEGAEVAGEISKKAIVIPDRSDWEKVFGVTAIFFKIISFFSLLVIGLVLVTLAPKIIVQAKDEMVKRPAQSLGWGFVFLVVVPVAVVLLMITIIGIPLALIIVPFYIIALYLSKVLVGFTIGLLILDNLTKDKKYKGSLVRPLALGLLILLIIVSIPYIGWLIKLLLVLWALGAAITVKREVLKEFR